MDDLAEDLDAEERATMLKKLDTSGDGRIEWKGTIGKPATAIANDPRTTFGSTNLCCWWVSRSPQSSGNGMKACALYVHDLQGESDAPLACLTTKLCAGAALRCVATGTWRKTMALTALGALRMKKTHHRNTSC